MLTKRATMRDVAQLAGVSLNVVSRVCRARGEVAVNVSAAARSKVLAAVEALGYYPDSRGRSLRNQRTQTIGFFSAYGWLYLGEGFPRMIFDGLQAGCSEYGQDLLMFHGIDIRSVREVVREMANAKVDGVVYLPRRGDHDLSEALIASHKPVVRIAEPHAGMPAVVTEDHDGARRLARHLSLRGHSHVGYRMSSFGLISADRRYAGFREAAAELGMTVVPMASDEESQEISPSERDILLSIRHSGITAVACWCDGSAARLLVFCRENRIMVPDDLAVVGFDGLDHVMIPIGERLTTLVVDWQRIAEIALARLIDVIDGKPVPDETVHPGSLFIGNTT